MNQLMGEQTYCIQPKHDDQVLDESDIHKLHSITNSSVKYPGLLGVDLLLKNFQIVLDNLSCPQLGQTDRTQSRRSLLPTLRYMSLRQFADQFPAPQCVIQLLSVTCVIVNMTDSP